MKGPYDAFANLSSTLLWIDTMLTQTKMRVQKLYKTMLTN